ncbi:MAG: hypothetical protein IJJ41_08790 [Clostridia bacterium]|nr:hypothetical protein [Clostridia bacterium]
MKRLCTVLLAMVVLLGFAACSKDKSDPTTTKKAATTTTAAQTQKETTTATTKKSETAKAKSIDTSFIYSGYWYKNAANKVLVFQFGKDGSVTVNHYRRNNIANEDNQPDAVFYGSFKDNGDGTLTVYEDNEVPDEYDIYRASAEGKLICENDDPEGSSTIELQHFDTLSKENAASVLFGE